MVKKKAPPESGLEDKPYIGTTGKPRKTKSYPKRNRMDYTPAVQGLFDPDKLSQPALAVGEAGRRVKKKKRKVQVGAGWSSALDLMEETGMTMKEFVAKLSPEELARGRIRNADGTFRGAPSQWVPAEFHKECLRQLLAQGKELYQINYLDAIRTMTDIATNVMVEPAQRIKAAQFVVERIEGKVPEKLEVSAAQPWQELLTGIVATIDPTTVPVRVFNEADGPLVIEGEVGDEA